MIDEDAVHARMRERAAAGDYAGALSEYVALEVHPDQRPSAATRRLVEELRRFAPPPLGTGRLEVVELDGDHSAAEQAELDDGEEDAFESLHLGLAWEDAQRRLVIRERGGRLLAAAGLLVTDVTVGGERVTVVGLGGVIVTHARRGEGLARHVLEAALHRAATLGPDLALLFCRPDRRGLYTKLGFAPVQASVNVGQPGGERRDMPLETLWRALRPGVRWPDGPVVLPGLPF